MIRRIKTVFGGTVSIHETELEKARKGRTFIKTVAGSLFHVENLVGVK